jgi:hypothetical protein
MPLEPTGALIARIDDDQPTAVGAGKEFDVPHEGHLFLGINESNLDDNTGSYDARIVVLPTPRFGRLFPPEPSR